MVRLLEIQDKLKQELAAAMETSDSAELNRLILKSEKLEMGSEPLVMQAKEVSFSIVRVLCVCAHPSRWACCAVCSRTTLGADFLARFLSLSIRSS
jgi:hypothetical protein